MTIYFISDLHLDESRPELTQAYKDFLASRITRTDELYILGDFFEAWLGDDHETAFNRSVIEPLSSCPGRVYVMHGNRDFLLGAKFCQEANCELLPDPSIIEIVGEKILLMHGDSLCTKDLAYMKARKTLRSAEFQADFLNQTIEERKTFAEGAREQSHAHTQQTKSAIMDVTQEEVEKIMQQNDVQTLIHGHTHRPCVHQLQINGKPSQRFVLGDWGEKTWYCRADSSGLHLESFP